MEEGAMEESSGQHRSGLIHVPGAEEPAPGNAIEMAIASTRRDMAAARRILNADELHRMKDRRPRFEKQIHLPGDSRRKNSVWFFSIDGMLDGAWVKGAMMAGDCILVQATSFEKAFKLAKDGLQSTIDLLELYHIADGKQVEETVMQRGMETGAAGRKARGDGTLSTDPKLKAMIAHQIGGLPWKW